MSGIEDNDILVITGNPPYNGKSQNNFPDINNLIKPYFPNDDIKERQVKWLNDDYVKFIRFAEHKIAQAGKGVVGIITNHGYLDNPTFRAMRSHLMKTFQQIYVIDLHGNSTKKEKSPDGSVDQNVFDIQQGVSISFFVKKEGLERGIYHKDIYGERFSKFQQLKELDLNLESFTKINPSEPFYLFNPKNEELWQEYKKGISLRDIFIESGVGMTTAHDGFVMDFEEKRVIKRFKEFKESERSLNLHTQFGVRKKEGWNILKAWDKFQEYPEEKIPNLIQKVNYRPFDTRNIMYEDTVVWRTVRKIMKHIITDNENVGLCFIRNEQGVESYHHTFISNTLVDLHLFSSISGASLAPLYLYKQDNLLEQGKIPNFQASFLSSIRDKYNNPSPEKILSYIYAILHSPTYRKTYLEFLKIDFPRIPFDVSLEEFNRLSTLGEKLINIHLMEDISIKEIPHSYRGIQGVLENNSPNPIVESIKYNEEQNRVYFNKTTFFGNISKEVWDFKIGGYQVIYKYLDERKKKKRGITNEVDHIEKVIGILASTLDIMKEIG